MAQSPADLVLQGGKIVAVDRSQPTAQALAVREDRIVAIGNNATVAKYIGEDTRLIDLNGRLAIPGIIEGHGHFVSLGQSMLVLDLRSAKSWQNVIAKVQEAVISTQPGEWIVGRGWHQEKWERPPRANVDGYPVHTSLSAISPNNPVLLTHASGHMCFANEAAMRIAGVDSTTDDPSGGTIVRDPSGNPIGIFRETAQSLITRAKHASDKLVSQEIQHRRTLQAIELATGECLKHGVTSFQDAGSSFALIDVFKRLADEGRLKVRLWVMVRDNNDLLARQLVHYRTIGQGHHYLTVRAIKRSIDGALGAHGAWLLAPYDDLLSSTGLNTTSINSLRRTAQLAMRHDFQLCVHAIGDRANRETLDIFEEAFQRDSDKKDRRWRIEHAQHLHKDDIPRFAEMGVIASMQGIHCTSDAVFVIQRLGARRAKAGAYVWRHLLDSGALVTNGTDAPVERIDPLACFHASVTRKLPSGVTFFPDQRMTRDEALYSYTLGAAHAAFEEDLKGSLTVGKLADIVVLSHDITSCPAEEITKARVDYTIVGGRIRYSAN